MRVQTGADFSADFSADDREIKEIRVFRDGADDKEFREFEDGAEVLP